MIDPAQYNILKAAGAITGIAQEDDAITVTTKAFDPNTGIPLPDCSNIFSLSSFQEQIDYYRIQLANLNQIIMDLSVQSQP